jgi:hypothetical protein
MKKLLVAWLWLASMALSAHAQTAAEMKNGGEQKRPGETEEQKGKRLLDEMLKALGGDAWLNKRTLYREGQTAAFFRGEPTGSVVRFIEYKKFASGSAPDLDRLEYLTVRGVIAPGMKRDVVHIWTADQGYEVTYKGQTTLPAKQVADYMRRRDHTIEEVMRTWVKQPGVTILAEGSGMRDRRPVDKVTILAANTNDSVTIEIDQETHLPLQRSFEWRNEQFKDKDIDEEVYGDWRIFDGVETPMNQTNYRNGDMAAQVFYTKASFNRPMADDLFDHTKLLKK